MENNFRNLLILYISDPSFLGGVILEPTTQLVSNCFQRKTLSNLEITDIIFRQSEHGMPENL